MELKEGGWKRRGRGPICKQGVGTQSVHEGAPYYSVYTIRQIYKILFFFKIIKRLMIRVKHIPLWSDTLTQLLFKAMLPYKISFKMLFNCWNVFVFKHLQSKIKRSYEKN